MTCPRSHIQREAKSEPLDDACPSPERRKNTYRVGMLKGVSLACMVAKQKFSINHSVYKDRLENKTKQNLKDIYQKIPV